MESDRHLGRPVVVLSAEAQAQMRALVQQQQHQQAQAYSQNEQNEQNEAANSGPNHEGGDQEDTLMASTSPISRVRSLPIHGRMSRTTAMRFQMNPEPAKFQRFTTARRSVVYSTKGMICCTQPLAARAGVRILEMGGNAADAAVAVAAALNVTEPMSTGIGGDLFCLFYDGRTKAVKALNGTGRAGQKMTYPAVRSSLGIDPDAPAGNIPGDSVHAVTVPGAAAGWCDVVERFGGGRVGMMDVLTPGMKLAYEGFPVSEVTAHVWQKCESLLLSSPNGRELLLYDRQTGTHRAPRAGEIFTNPNLASTFLSLATHGKRGFYGGDVAEAIISVTQDQGGLLDHDDLAHHLTVGGSETTEPICYDFRGQGLSAHDGSNLVVWEHAPNSQGLIALIALGLFEEFERSSKIPRFGQQDFLGLEYVHAIIEAVRIAFKEGARYIGDPDEGSQLHNPHAARHILARRSPDRGSVVLERWARQFDPSRAIGELDGGNEAARGSDTVYFSVIDGQGNAASFVNSNYADFGSGLVPAGTGFVLHNRGAGFGLDPRGNNCLLPRRRPYHTLIPGLVTHGRRDDRSTATTTATTTTAAAAGSTITTSTTAATPSSTATTAAAATMVNAATSTAEGNMGTSSTGTANSTSTSSSSPAPTRPNQDGALHSVFGVKGGFVQPQGHLQVLLAQVVGGCDAQQALDAPRICVGPGMPERGGSTAALGGDSYWTVRIEKGLDEDVVEGLRQLGHKVLVVDDWDRSVFGRGQIIRAVVDPGTGRRVYMGGTDGRGDGITMPL